MSIKKLSARQTPAYAEVVINFSDLVSGVAQNAIELPGGASIIDADVVVDTAFNSATSDTLSVGDSGNTARYLSGATIHAAGLTPLVTTGYTMPAVGDVQVLWTGTGAAPTAGALRLRVSYIVSGKSDYTQGLDARPPLASAQAPGA